LDASQLKIIRKGGEPTPLPPLDTLVFGRTFSDHMLDVDWDVNEGWRAPVIRPFQNLSIHPAASSLHYALQCFDGMKAYKDDSGRIRMFRPDMNARRLLLSSQRLGLPSFDELQLVECIKALLSVDSSQVPQKDGYSMYIRPTSIATQPTLGVGPPSQTKLFVILSPVGPYYPTGFKPVQLLADTHYIRAWPGGTGDRKVGANYGPTILPQTLGAKKGYSQMLWLFPEGDDYRLTEVGTMNLFILWKNEQGEKELVTEPLGDLILPGVTRDSIIKLAQKMHDIKVSERPVYMKKDFLKAVAEKRILEVFGAGTAAVVSPVDRIGFDGVDYPIPVDPDNPSAGIGPLAKKLLKELNDIQYGRVPHEWSWLV